jgi:M3 family oligoendopeptidase
MKKIKNISVLFLLISSLLFVNACGMRIVKIEVPKPSESITPTAAPTAEPSVAPTEEPEVTDFDYKRGLTSYSDMEYIAPDYDKIANHIAAIDAMLTDGTDSETILGEYEQLEDEFLDFYSQYSLLSVYSSEDVNDTEISDLVESLSEQYTELGVLSTKLEINIYNSEHKDIVFWDWTERDFHNLLVSEKLYDDEYVTLNKRLTELTNEYWDAMNNTTVDVNGEALTLDELNERDDLTDAEHSLYLESWYANANTAVGELYLEYINVNKRIAEKAGYDDYNDYAYDYVYERDYTPEDSRSFYEYIKDNVCDMMHSLYNSLTYEEYAGLIMASRGTGQIDMRKNYIEEHIKEISGEMNEAYHYLNDYSLITLTSGEGSQAGAYTTYFPYYDTPFIYLNETGGYSDVFTFIHEFGHFYGNYVGGVDAMLYQSTDVSEIMSQADELLFMPKLYDFYNESTADGIIKYQMFNYLAVMVQGCLYDEFQQYLYANDVQTVDEINQVFAELSESYELGQDFYTLPLEYMWIDVMHNFEAPLYYISYATSIIPALEIFEISNTDREEAIDIYNKVVHSDAKSSFGEVLTDCGLKSPFLEDTIINIISSVSEYTGVTAQVK